MKENLNYRKDATNAYLSLFFIVAIWQIYLRYTMGVNMKAIVVYYSLEGDAKYVAEKIAKKIGADILRLEPVKAYPTGKVSKFIWGGKSVVFGDRPKLKEYKFSKEKYDTVILGTPVWAGKFTPPIKTFLSQNDLKGKKIGLFACCGGGSTDKCFAKMKEVIGGQESYSTLSLINPAKNISRENDKEIEKYCRKFLKNGSGQL